MTLNPFFMGPPPRERDDHSGPAACQGGLQSRVAVAYDAPRDGDRRLPRVELLARRRARGDAGSRQDDLRGVHRRRPRTSGGRARARHLRDALPHERHHPRGRARHPGLGIAGGLLPDPGALAILLAALASGKLLLGLFTVVVFSVGFASVLVIVGVIAARVGAAVLTWLSGRWVGRLQLATAALIVTVGLALTVNAWRAVTAFH